MKATSNSICMLCRHALTTRASRRAVAPWYPQAAATAYSTVSDVKEPSTTEPTQNTKERSFRQVLVQGERPSKPSEVTVVKEPRTQRRLQPKSDTDINALFKEIVDQTKDNNNVASADHNSTSAFNVKLISDIAELESIVDSENLPISMAYLFLKTKLYPVIRQEGVNIPQVFFPVVSKLMLKMIEVKKLNISATDLPPVADIFRICVDIGEMDPRLWTTLVERLVDTLCEMSLSPADYPSIEAYEKNFAMRDEMLTDLVESWKVLSLPKDALITSINQETDITDGFWFPRLEKSLATKFANSKHFVAAFNSLFPQYPSNQLGPRVSILAIATYILLLDPERSNANVRQRAARFMSMVAAMLNIVGLNINRLKEYLSHSSTSSTATSKYIKKQWPSIQASLERNTVNVDARSLDSRSATVSRANANAYSAHRASIEKRLSRAYYGTRRLAEVDQIWYDFIGKPADLTPDRVAELREQQDIFNSFINTYMAMDSPDMAIVVWNTLSRLGLKPNLKTWNVMLDGCRKARNVKGLNKVWERLQSSGLTLDISIWTTRVAGLIHCGDPKGAIEALEELVKRWHMAKQDPTKTPKPTIEPVNAAMTGLVRLEKLKAAQSLLTWSSRQGIRPDIVSFNILLRPLIRDGRDKDVQGLLDTMKSLGINADAATFTIVLDGTLANVPLDDIQSQADVIKAIFDKMKGAGLQTNLHTYGKMIYLLLRSGDRAQESVKLVLSHLWSQGYELSPHIYTMLVEHYFARQPPDLDAVNGLLLRRRLLDYDDMDRVFYDRVIKGFTYVGDLDTALGIYRKLYAAGFVVELDTQLDLLRALIARRDGGGDGGGDPQAFDAEARRLVEGTMQRFKELHSDDWQAPQHARFWSHAYWHLAVRSGILREFPVSAFDNMNTGYANV